MPRLSEDPVTPYKDEETLVQHEGLTVREYYAAAALTGLLAGAQHHSTEVVDMAFVYADRMITRGQK